MMVLLPMNIENKTDRKKITKENDNEAKTRN